MPTFYHVSKSDLGEKVVLRPQIPDSADALEGLDPRVCFAPSIRQCIHSVHGGSRVTENQGLEAFMPYKWREAIENPVVYVTRKTLFKPSPKISDFALTEEHWSLEPIAVRRHGYIDIRAFMLQNPGMKVPITRMPTSKVTPSEFTIWRQVMRRNSHPMCPSLEFDSYIEDGLAGWLEE